MSYILNSITLRTDNSEGGMAKLNEVWRDIVSGKLPLMHGSDSQFLQGLSPISRY